MHAAAAALNRPLGFAALVFFMECIQVGSFLEGRLVLPLRMLMTYNSEVFFFFMERIQVRAA